MQGYTYFSYFHSKTDCGYSLEPTWGGGSNVNPQCFEQTY